MEDMVSVIVPVYNVEKYIRRCVHSIVNQTYSNIEILLIDDGSTDNSYNICKDYEKNDLRIRAFHKENEGLGLTRNYGLKRAKGKFVVFVDSDDYIVSNAIEILCLKQKETDADIVIASYFYKGISQDIYLPERVYMGEEIRDILMVHAMGNLPGISDGLSSTVCGKIYKKSLISENGFAFPSEKEMIWEDLVFNTNVYPACEKIYVSHFPIYQYCFNEESLTHTYKPNKLEMVMNLYKYMVDSIKKMELGEEAQKRLDTNFIGHIRTCIKLEVFYAQINGRKIVLNNIRKICGRSDVQKLIRNYPEQDFNKIQYIYNVFMKRNFAVGVYFLTWLQNKKKKRIE